MRRISMVLAATVLLSSGASLAQEAPADSPFQVEGANGAAERAARAKLNKELLEAEKKRIAAEIQAAKAEKARAEAEAARLKAEAEEKARAEAEAARLKAEQERLERERAAQQPAAGAADTGTPANTQ